MKVNIQEQVKYIVALVMVMASFVSADKVYSNYSKVIMYWEMFWKLKTLPFLWKMMEKAKMIRLPMIFDYIHVDLKDLFSA